MIRSVSYLLNSEYQILSIADEFAEFRHTDDRPFCPGEVWGSEIWAHIRENNLAPIFRGIFNRARHRPVTLPIRIDNVEQFCLWEVEAERAGEALLVSFRLIVERKRGDIESGKSFKRVVSPVDFCGWCNRVREPGAKPYWLHRQGAEYLQGLRVISPSAVRVKLCEECAPALLQGHESKLFAHLNPNPGGEVAAYACSAKTMHRQQQA